MNDDEELAEENEINRLADASWAAGVLSEQDFLEIQSKGTSISEGREYFYLEIYKMVSETKALVEAYIALNLDKATEEQEDILGKFCHEVMTAFYVMCVNAGVLDVNFWQQD